MLKISPTAIIREADAFTIVNGPVLSVGLIERSTSAVIDWFMKNRLDLRAS